MLFCSIGGETADCFGCGVKYGSIQGKQFLIFLFLKVFVGQVTDTWCDFQTAHKLSLLFFITFLLKEKTGELVKEKIIFVNI